MTFSSWSADICSSYSLIFHCGQRGEGVHTQASCPPRPQALTPSSSPLWLSPAGSPESHPQPLLQQEIGSRQRGDRAKHSMIHPAKHFSAACFGRCECTPNPLGPILGLKSEKMHFRVFRGGWEMGAGQPPDKDKKTSTLWSDHLMVSPCGFPSLLLSLLLR